MQVPCSTGFTPAHIVFTGDGLWPEVFYAFCVTNKCTVDGFTGDWMCETDFEVIDVTFTLSTQVIDAA